MRPITEPAELREFKQATTRAFAGTRWRPVQVTTFTHLDRLRYRITLQLDMDDLLATVPFDEFVPRAARVRSPRFYLRSKVQR